MSGIEDTTDPLAPIPLIHHQSFPPESLNGTASVTSPPRLKSESRRAELRPRALNDEEVYPGCHKCNIWVVNAIEVYVEAQLRPELHGYPCTVRNRLPDFETRFRISEPPVITGEA
jgi:hypothetical protein